MFSGIGSGVSGLGGSSPITGQAGPFTSAALAKREDLDGPESGPDAAKGPKGRRRKLKDEDGRDDDSSGRLTPGHKAKRTKGHQHHHHQYVNPVKSTPSKLANLYSHHHHHHHKPEEGSQSTTPLRNIKGNTPGADGADKVLGPHHHHHHHHGAGRAVSGQQKQAAQNTTTQIPPRTKTIVSSQAVLDAAAKHKRQHLGDYVYETELKPQRLVPNTPIYRGFSSSPKPLPMDMIKDKINCTLTVKIPRVHLSRTSREEITSRAFLWGTDVYSDDSDVVAACIHAGWIKGEWNDDVDVAMLNLDTHAKVKKDDAVLDQHSEQLISSPPESGPMEVPGDRDLHVNVLILPKLSKYASTTRYGISSREFGGEFGSRHVSHDGLSYMIHGIRWVENGGKPQARLRGKARRERMRKAMQEVRSASVSNVSGTETNGDSRSQIKGNWWRKENPQEEPKDGEKMERKASEGDKENRLASDKAASEDPKGEAKDAEMAETPKEIVEGEK